MYSTDKKREAWQGQFQFGGHVISGRGAAAPELLGLSEELHAIVRETIYPGSLNIVLNRPLRLRDTAAFAFDRERRMLWPAASLNGVDVWIYRWPACPLHIIEVLSSIHLRERLKLKDGDHVILRLSDEQIGTINPLGRLAWAALWVGRRHWFYSDPYYDKTLSLCTKLGAAQQQPVVKGLVQLSFVAVKEIMAVMKEIIKRTPIIGTLARKVKSKFAGDVNLQRSAFSRMETDICATDDERLFRQIRNLLNYTKTSNSSYSAQQFPAGYHTINLNGQQILGQRDPSKRLSLAPVDFCGKTVLDLGCNQGGMIHQIATSVKWAVGVDFEFPHDQRSKPS